MSSVDAWYSFGLDLTETVPAGRRMADRLHVLVDDCMMSRWTGVSGTVRSEGWGCWMLFVRSIEVITL